MVRTLYFQLTYTAVITNIVTIDTLILLLTWQIIIPFFMCAITIYTYYVERRHSRRNTMQRLNAKICFCFSYNGAIVVNVHIFLLHHFSGMQNYN